MSKSRERSLSPLEKLERFLQLDEEELSSMSPAEVQEELLCMGAELPNLKSQILNLISETADVQVDDGQAGAHEAPLPDWFGMDPNFPTLGDQLSVYLSSAAALGEAASDQSQLKEVPLISFFGESTLTEELRWVGPMILIAKDLDDENQNLARHIAYVDAEPSQDAHTSVLRIVLGTLGGRRSEVRLSSGSPSGIFVGDLLPADWDLVYIQLFIEPKWNDA